MANYAITFSTKNVTEKNIINEQNFANQSVIGSIKQNGNRVFLNLNGDKEKSINIIRSIWELASLYDGYFYKPETYIVDGRKKEAKDLFYLPYYKTGKIWNSFAMPLVGAEKDFSSEMIQAYIGFRDRNRAGVVKNQVLINSYYYLRSEDYDGINVNHRLCLFLNLCDGLARSFYGTKDVHSSVRKLLKSTMLSPKVKYGASLLGIPEEKIYRVLANERHEIDHYVIVNGSLIEYVMNSDRPSRYYINFYFTYMIELAARIAVLNEIGCHCNSDLINDALDTVNDWVILECDLNEPCGKEINRFRQYFKKMGIEFL